jgi:hypothetical protein
VIRQMDKLQRIQVDDKRNWRFHINTYYIFWFDTYLLHLANTNMFKLKRQGHQKSFLRWSHSFLISAHDVYSVFKYMCLASINMWSVRWINYKGYRLMIKEIDVFTLIHIISFDFIFSGVRVTRSLVWCVMFCRSLFVLFHLVIVLIVFGRRLDKLEKLVSDTYLLHLANTNMFKLKRQGHQKSFLRWSHSFLKNEKRLNTFGDVCWFFGSLSYWRDVSNVIYSQACIKRSPLGQIYIQTIKPAYAVTTIKQSKKNILSSHLYWNVSHCSCLVI